MTGYSKDMKGTRKIIEFAIDKQNSNKDIDSLFLICGEEGSGKSNTILNIIQIWEELTNKEIPFEQVAVDLKGLLYSLSYNNKSIHALDEGEELSNLNQFDRTVKLVKKCLVVSRARAQIVLISYPNPLKINPYLKEDRAKGLFFCYKQKYLYYFTRSKFRQIRERIAKNTNVKSINDFVTLYSKYATLVDTVPEYKGHLKESYLQRKSDNIDTVFKEALTELYGEEETYSLSKVTRMLGISKETVYKAIGEKIIVPEWNATKTKMRITKKQIKILTEHLNPDIIKKSTSTPTLISGEKI